MGRIEVLFLSREQVIATGIDMPEIIQILEEI